MESEEIKLGKLTEESLKRKERLRQLRGKAQKSDKDSYTKGTEELPRPIFRSYKPQNENTEGEVLDQEPSGDIEKAVEGQLELLNQPMIIDEIDIANLAPRKPDWDLKRDVSKKLERLERRTQKAIAELIRERLKKNQTDQEIFQAVNVGTAHAGEATTVDDD
ncbi:PREDICTED: coiled-coil domain-containing protein 12 [Rhagoletis zephyria]|uniref:coiled-coil domain-containing protein 12 n=1 Tax=Rhagoletis zephyria TaxID=28612 RepID=UPI00081120A4|nr:PREDICTED: coiled-coil domain-containing protein 12 [Rhagoletis zephyria]XP_036323009.1 coiled-coil domain-containing protein 12 [Rhagoletis pomonella]